MTGKVSPAEAAAVAAAAAAAVGLISESNSDQPRRLCHDQTARSPLQFTYSSPTLNPGRNRNPHRLGNRGRGRGGAGTRGRFTGGTVTSDSAH